MFLPAIKKVHLSTKLWVIDGFSMKGKRSKIQFPIFRERNYILSSSTFMFPQNSWSHSYIICIFSELLNKGPLGVKVGVLGYGILSLISFSFPMNIIIKMFGHPCFISNLESNYIYIFNIFKFNFLLIYMKA